jgi:hypothetical protein
MSFYQDLVDSLFDIYQTFLLIDNISTLKAKFQLFQLLGEEK